ncbi:hypothetical protein H2199_003673 [Coniosporium tulheliwenetii]|uniref:Uncharacterized protein n=1 Tax=Coniosporium tulheliwenetii TaxID=3383036 RepID=A0ACC2ZBK3_9PEZI|nr:hypothetical protein H2199_003673 [Cladosporium sp. JES 115]
MTDEQSDEQFAHTRMRDVAHGNVTRQQPNERLVHSETEDAESVSLTNQPPSEQPVQTEHTAHEIDNTQPGTEQSAHEIDDDQGSVADSTFYETASDTTSLKSNIFKYRYENGRRYHAYKDGAYWGPNDEDAADHLDIAHHLFLLTLNNKLHLAPLPGHVENVLDIGTGTGIWAMCDHLPFVRTSAQILIAYQNSDFADLHPEAEVIGTDLSPTQPGFVPPNLKFIIDDATDEWTWPENHFDFVHVRSLFGCFSDWPAFYEQCFRHLKPGGWIEQVEMAPGFRSDDGTVEREAIGMWHDLGVKCGEANGKTFRVMYDMRRWIEEAGFKEVVETVYKWPIGSWPKDKKWKEIGRWSRLHIETGLESWSLAVLTRVMGWSVQEAQILIAKVKANLRDPSIHGWHEMRVVYATKPRRES